MITKLNTKSKHIAGRIVEIQKCSYQIEADLIQAESLPPLKDTVTTIQESDEEFLGYQEREVLAGFLAYEQTGDIVTITRLAIDPAYFRKKFASRLLDWFIEKERGPWQVMTGSENTPAISLYQKYGFEIVSQIETKEGILLAKLIRKA